MFTDLFRPQVQTADLNVTWVQTADLFPRGGAIYRLKAARTRVQPADLSEKTPGRQVQPADLNERETL